MLFLPVPRFQKDASRAVHRITGLKMQNVTLESLSHLLNLPGMRIDQFAIEQQEEHQYLHLFCQHERDFALCPHCFNPAAYGYDQKERCVRHLDIFGMRVFVHFSGRRFDCSICGKPFTEKLSWLTPKRRQTNAFEHYIFQRIKTTPRKHVALEEGLSESTVLDIFKRMAKVNRNNAGSAPRVLGVDEISLRKGHKQYALVISDLQRRCIIAVLENRSKETFVKWLETFSETQRRNIKVVSMDMWRPYKEAVRKSLPHAEIVADRFHVMKQLNHQIDIIRRAVQKKADDELAGVLKGSRWILLKNREDLTPQEEEKLRMILAADEQLRQVYLLKEQFRTICHKIYNKDQAERFLKAWMWLASSTGNPYLKRFVNTLQNWWQEFLNYFDERVTQGFVEGINRAIRGITNRAFGYRCFENFRYQVIIECGDP